MLMWIAKRKAAFDRRFFPEKARRWRRWKQHDAGNRRAIDHGAWAAFLATHVRVGGDGSTRVAYGAVPAPDIARLEGYLAAAATTAISGHGRDEQLAYWANLYNALTVRLVIAHYPLRSIRNVGGRPVWLGGGPWNRRLITVEGMALTLNDIEHRVLRRNWRDPRLHYAVNCASLGCPDLLPEPFLGDRVQDQLDEAARRFVNHPRGVRFDGDRLVVCRIYQWFIEDFGGTDAGVLDHLRRLADPPLAARLARAQRIDGYQYDWRLNDAG